MHLQGFQFTASMGIPEGPQLEMLKNVDVLVFDIQDIGARFYTYITTMAYCMEEAAKARIPFYVLDRPNPIGGFAWKARCWIRTKPLLSDICHFRFVMG